MKSFSKKSVALMLFAIVLCGFFYSGTAKAATVDTNSVGTIGNSTQPTTVTYTDGSTGSRYYYLGNGFWQQTPIGSNNIPISTEDMQSFHYMPIAVVNLA